MGSKGRMQKPRRKRERLSSAPVKRPAHRPRSVQTNSMARWLDASPMSVYEVAEKLRVTPEHVWNLRIHARKPSRSLAVAIEELSEGLVPVASW